MIERNRILESLGRVVGPGNLLTDPDALGHYGTDWTRFYAPDPLAVVFAQDTEQLVRLIGFASENGLSLVPSGGRTGLSAGAVAARQEVVVSFEKMNRILAFDAVDRTVTVQPGVVTATLQAFAREHGLIYPVDFASAGSSQIGGNIATNAGGIKVLRYGLTRDQVVGLEVVTGGGEVLSLNKGLVKNATGYDLRHLFIGSEGTLGFITEATIALRDAPGDLTVALLSVPSMQAVMSVLANFRRQVSLTAFEFFSEEALKAVLARHPLGRPLSLAAPYYALIEFDGSPGPAFEAFEHCVAEGIATDGVVSQSEQQRLDLWKYREYISEAISHRTPYKNDIAVRVSQVPGFLSAVEEIVNLRYPDFEIIWFGHIGDGNLHLNILKPGDLDIDRFKAQCEKVSEEVLAIVAGFGGSVSAEHGVGMLKRDQLHFSRSPAEIALMKSIKRTFDPHGIMNPGKLLPD